MFDNQLNERASATTDVQTGQYHNCTISYTSCIVNGHFKIFIELPKWNTNSVISLSIKIFIRIFSM